MSAGFRSSVRRKDRLESGPGVQPRLVAALPAVLWEKAVASSQASLSGIRVFADLPAEDIEQLSQRCLWRRYEAGQTILGHLEDSDDVYFIVAGAVRATAYSLSGKEVQYRDIGCGEVFGEYSAIDEQPRSADVVALEDAHLASLRAEAFREILRQHPEVAMATMKHLTRQVRGLTERVFEFSALAASNRLHVAVLRLAREHLTDENAAAIPKFPTHKDIAPRIASHREAVSREMKVMERDGLVERQGTTLIIPDVERLEQKVWEVLGDQPIDF